jgi:hypothetical protein
MPKGPYPRSYWRELERRRQRRLDSAGLRAARKKHRRVLRTLLAAVLVSAATGR